jgi:polar amino acid transport system substrate-binding protein
MERASGKIPFVRLVAVIVAAIGFVAAMVTIFDYWERHKAAKGGPSPLPGGQLSDTLTSVQERKRLVVGYIPYYDMTSRSAIDGRVAGFLVDVLHELAQDLSVPNEGITFVETDWQNFGLGLSEGKYDLSIAGTFRTPARERVASFTRPLGFLGNGALVRRGDTRFQRVQQLNQPDVRVAVVLGEQGYEYALHFLPLARLKIMPGPDLSLACLEVERGRVDAALSDQFILKRYVAQHPRVVDALENAPYAVLPISWAVRKGDLRWLQYINSRIAFYDQSGWLRHLRLEYSQIPWAPPANETIAPETPKRFVADYAWAFFTGVLYTIGISVAAIIIGTSIGIPLALLITQSRARGWRWVPVQIAKAYIYLFLAVPPLVLIIILYYNNYLVALTPRLQPFLPWVLTYLHLLPRSSPRAFNM